MALLIFALQIIRHVSKKLYYIHPASLKGIDINIVNSSLVPELLNSKNGKGLWNLCTRCILLVDCITGGISPDKIQPPFDILKEQI